MAGAPRKRAEAKPASRDEKRHVVPGSLTMILTAAEREFAAAADRYRSVHAVLSSHTLWEHSDGRDLCDHDGEQWPCSTVVGMGFIYGVRVPEQWERTR